MSLKRNVVANAASQGILAILGFVAVPVYLRYLGVEAYGLVGFAGVVVVLHVLFDLGLTAAFSRELSQVGAGTTGLATLRALMQVLERLFLAAGVALALAIVALADPIARLWLDVGALSLADVSACVVLMGLSLPARWLSNLYRATVTGLERLDLASTWNVVLGAVRIGGGVLVLTLIDPRPTTFFAWHLFASLLEATVFMVVARRLLVVPLSAVANPVAATLRRLAPFAMHMAFATGVWLAVTNADRLLLSKVLPLSEYGLFTIAATVAGFVTLLTAPLAMAAQPRLARLIGEGADATAIALYRKTTQFACVLAAPTSMMLAAGAEPLLRAWTGDATAAAAAAPTLVPYALGNGVLAIAGLPYQLQYARGQLRLHNVSNVLLLVLLVPALLLGALRYGGPGAGVAWLVLQLAYLLFWTPIVHRRFAPGVHARWLAFDLAPILLLAAVGTWLSLRLLSTVGLPAGRPALLFALACAGVLPLAAAVVASSACREAASLWFARWRHQARNDATQGPGAP
ncbi:MAG: oligosaccharide flippase family protein [Deltaproteobacteria bacterium]|nr:oligosaccharide flippase family protein [Deltaproteobacteria bacterium]